MAIARIDKFIEKLKPLNNLAEIKILCNLELDYLRTELGIETVFSNNGYPNGVNGDARRLKTQVSAYRKAIDDLDVNYQNGVSKIVNGEKVYKHKALRYFNLAKYEKNDVNQRDRTRVRQDKTNRHSFDAVAVIERALSLLDCDSYISKVAGLYLLTGRRHEEILITGKFENPIFAPDDESLLSEWLEYDLESALFSGQVKRKGNSDNPYNIPLLASLEIIQTATHWLRTNKPHQPGQRPKGSKELGLKVRKVFQETGLLPFPAGKDDYLNPHNLRSAYSAICWQLYRHSPVAFNCTEDIFIKAIMGHLEDSTQSAQAYLDYELRFVEVTKLINKYYNSQIV
jgi:hypothetical protein